MIYQYDGGSLSSDLQLMPPDCYRAFGVACAEALVVDFGAAVPGHVLSGTALARMVHDCWSAVEHADPDVLESWLSVLDEVISGDHYEELGVGEHVVNGLHYALECLRDDDAGSAELVSSNLYEAADYIALEEQPGAVISLPQEALNAHPVVQGVLKKIDGLMGLLRGHAAAGSAPPVDLAAVRELARSRTTG
jgi:hypothetical protein